MIVPGQEPIEQAAQLGNGGSVQDVPFRKLSRVIRPHLLKLSLQGRQRRRVGHLQGFDRLSIADTGTASGALVTIWRAAGVALVASAITPGLIVSVAPVAPDTESRLVAPMRTIGLPRLSCRCSIRPRLILVLDCFTGNPKTARGLGNRHPFAVVVACAHVAPWTLRTTA